MRKIYVAILVICALITTSCQFKETIHFQEDGSGKLSFKVDGSELMAMAGEEMGSGKEKNIDSVISFKKLFDEKKDSIAQLSAEQQAKLKTLEPFNMHMLMNQEKKQMKMEFYADFDNVNDMQNMFEAMNTISELDGKSSGAQKQNPLSAMGSGTTEIEYKFEDNVFSRKVKIVDEDAFKTSIKEADKMAMMMASFTYQLEYHFPRKIKSVSMEEAVISEDGKSMTLNVNFMEYVKNPESFDLKVKLED